MTRVREPRADGAGTFWHEFTAAELEEIGQAGLNELFANLRAAAVDGRVLTTEQEDGSVRLWWRQPTNNPHQLGKV